MTQPTVVGGYLNFLPRAHAELHPFQTNQSQRRDAGSNSAGQKAGGGKRDRLGELAASKTGVEGLDGDDLIRFQRQDRNDHGRDHGIGGLGLKTALRPKSAMPALGRLATQPSGRPSRWTFRHTNGPKPEGLFRGGIGDDQWTRAPSAAGADMQHQEPGASDAMPRLPSASDTVGVQGHGGQKQDQQCRARGSSLDASRSNLGVVPATDRRQIRVVVMRRFGLATRKAGAREAAAADPNPAFPLVLPQEDQCGSEFRSRGGPGWNGRSAARAWCRKRSSRC